MRTGLNGKSIAAPINAPIRETCPAKSLLLTFPRIITAINKTDKNKEMNRMRLNGGAKRNSTIPGWEDPYSNNVIAAPTNANTKDISCVPRSTPGNTSDGVDINNVTSNARTNAPKSCEITASALILAGVDTLPNPVPLCLSLIQWGKCLNSAPILP